MFNNTLFFVIIRAFLFTCLQCSIPDIPRYIQNNFLDGVKQDSYDLLLGNHRYTTVEESPLAKPRHPVAILLPAAIAVFFAILVLKVGVVLLAGVK